MGNKFAKPKKRLELSSLQTLTLSYNDFNYKCEKYLEGFFLNDDVDLLQIENTRIWSANKVQEDVEKTKPAEQKYFCFFHPSKSDVMCVLKKNVRTEKLHDGWTQNSYDAMHGEVESLMILLLQSFFDDASVDHFTLYNIDSLNFAQLDSTIRQFQKQYSDLKITKKSMMASGKYLNCVISKAIRNVTPTGEK